MLFQFLEQLTAIVVPAIDFIALVVIAIGTLQASVSGVVAMLSRSGEMNRIRVIWIRYSYWLIAGLTFQLAADIVQSSTAPDWEEIGQLAAIAVIRTFLNYFLERDQEVALKRSEAASQAPETRSG